MKIYLKYRLWNVILVRVGWDKLFEIDHLCESKMFLHVKVLLHQGTVSQITKLNYIFFKVPLPLMTPHTFCCSVDSILDGRPCFAKCFDNSRAQNANLSALKRTRDISHRCIFLSRQRKRVSCLCVLNIIWTGNGILLFAVLICREQL